MTAVCASASPAVPSSDCSFVERCCLEAASTSSEITNECQQIICVAHQKFIYSGVPHVRQMFNWDCGLACALMVLRAVGFNDLDYSTLRRYCATTSVWTIDLAHVLRRFGLDVSFFTVTLGPNPAFVNESFYVENIEEDEQRVQNLFYDAAEAGISIQQRSVSTCELQEALLTGKFLIIMLVDKRRLCPWLAAADLCLQAAFCGVEFGYTGHYILLIGYDSEFEEFIVRDPAACHAELRVSCSVIDQARRSFGTDEDLLLVSTTLTHQKPTYDFPPMWREFEQSTSDSSSSSST